MATGDDGTEIGPSSGNMASNITRALFRIGPSHVVQSDVRYIGREMESRWIRHNPMVGSTVRRATLGALVPQNMEITLYLQNWGK